jgi:predicted acetyltransferase
VGTGGAFSLQLTVPGAIAATGGTTMVSVLPTHRRRGVLRQMMRHHLEDVRERGEPLAALWASESGIYGRFGYGAAVQMLDLVIQRSGSGFARPLEAEGRVRLVAVDEAEQPLRTVFDAVRPLRPGMFARSEAWWRLRRLRDDPAHRSGASPYRFAVYENAAGEPEGYAQYRTKPDWDLNPKGSVTVTELVTLTRDAHAALWRFLLDIDLVATINAWNRPEDETLPWLLADSRRAQRRLSDTLWVRTVDVAAALEARRYPVDGDVVIDIRDQFCPWNDGSYRLVVTDGIAAVERTRDAAGLSMPVEDLGAVYLGGNRVLTLARAGRIEGDPEAIRRTDAMFLWDRAPWCQEVF